MNNENSAALSNTNQSKFNNKVDGWIGMIGSIMLGLSGLLAALVLLYQGYFWLRFGVWVSMPFYKALNFLDIYYYPSYSGSWVGFNDLRSGIEGYVLSMHMSIVIPILTFIAFWFVGSIIDMLLKKKPH